MNRERGRQNPLRKEIAQPTVYQENYEILALMKERLLKTLEENYADCFTLKELDKISRNPDFLYFSLSSEANSILKKKGWDGFQNLQDLTLNLMILHSRIEKTREKEAIKFPAERASLFAGINRWPRPVRALALAFFIATSAFALEAGRRLMASPEETGIKTAESADAEIPKKPKGVICAEKTCFFVPGTEETQQKTKQDAKSTLKLLVQAADASGQLSEELQ